MGGFWSLVRRWVHKEASPWEFWLPGSNVIGGIIIGAIAWLLVLLGNAVVLFMFGACIIVACILVIIVVFEDLRS